MLILKKKHIGCLTPAAHPKAAPLRSSLVRHFYENPISLHCPLLRLYFLFLAIVVVVVLAFSLLLPHAFGGFENFKKFNHFLHIKLSYASFACAKRRY